MNTNKTGGLSTVSSTKVAFKDIADHDGHSAEPVCVKQDLSAEEANVLDELLAEVLSDSPVDTLSRQMEGTFTSSPGFA